MTDEQRQAIQNYVATQQACVFVQAGINSADRTGQVQVRDFLVGLSDKLVAESSNELEMLGKTFGIELR